MIVIYTITITVAITIMTMTTMMMMMMMMRMMMMMMMMMIDLPDGAEGAIWGATYILAIRLDERQGNSGIHRKRN